MATDPNRAAARPVSISRVFSRAFATIGANWRVIGLVALLFVAVPGIVLQLAVEQITALEPRGDDAYALIAIAVISGFASIALALILQGALVGTTVAHHEGRKALFGEAAMTGVRGIIPLLLLAILVGVGALFGLMLLLVPGIFLLTIWSVAAPALVNERRGVFGALSRSSALTKGARWRVLGTGLVLFVIYLLITSTLGVFQVMATGGLEAMASDNAPQTHPALTVAGGVLQALTSALGGVVITSLYIELREWHEGPASGRLAEIFA